MPSRTPRRRGLWADQDGIVTQVGEGFRPRESKSTTAYIGLLGYGTAIRTAALRSSAPFAERVGVYNIDDELAALDVEQHDRARLQAQPAARGEVGQGLVDGLAGRADELREPFCYYHPVLMAPARGELTCRKHHGDLVAAVQAADLVKQLKGAGPYTVFAPTDDAFAKIPKADLDALLATGEWLQGTLGRPIPSMLLKAGSFPKPATQAA